jgi:hypothetical protein
MAVLEKIRRVSTPPARSAERQALANAIARRGDADARLAQLNAARQKATHKWWVAHEACREAAAALDEARSRESANLAAAALGEKPTGPSLEELQEKLSVANRTYDLERRTIAALDEQLAEAKQQADGPIIGLKQHVNAVIASEPAVANLVERRSRTARELTALDVTLHALSLPLKMQSQAGFFATFDHDAMADPKWTAWISALSTDPDAQPPQ